VDDVEIFVGTNIASTAHKSNRYRVKRVIVNEGFSLLTSNRDTEEKRKINMKLFNDIALLEIDGGIKLNKFVKALRIAPSGFDPSCKLFNSYLIHPQQHPSKTIIPISFSIDQTMRTKW
jgi:hypothetical protein